MKIQPIEITNEIIEQAKTWNVFDANKNSMYDNNKEQLFRGNLGEIIFYNHYKNICTRISDVDFNADFIVKEKRIDVKVRTGMFKPKLNYEVSIPASQKNYNVDYYFFCYLYQPKNLMYLLGSISKIDFYNNAKFYKIGDVLHGTEICKQNNYQLEIGKLKLVCDL